MREVSIGETYEGEYNSLLLITFEIFERHNLCAWLQPLFKLGRCKTPGNLGSTHNAGQPAGNVRLLFSTYADLLRYFRSGHVSLRDQNPFADRSGHRRL